MVARNINGHNKNGLFSSHRDPGEVPSGALVFVLARIRAPAGYTFVGSFDMKLNPEPGGAGPRTVAIRIFRKN